MKLLLHTLQEATCSLQREHTDSRTISFGPPDILVDVHILCTYEDFQRRKTLWSQHKWRRVAERRMFYVIIPDIQVRRASRVSMKTGSILCNIFTRHLACHFCYTSSKRNRTSAVCMRWGRSRLGISSRLFSCSKRAKASNDQQCYFRGIRDYTPRLCVRDSLEFVSR